MFRVIHLVLAAAAAAAAATGAQQPTDLSPLVHFASTPKQRVKRESCFCVLKNNFLGILRSHHVCLTTPRRTPGALPVHSNPADRVRDRPKKHAPSLPAGPGTEERAPRGRVCAVWRAAYRDPTFKPKDTYGRRVFYKMRGPRSAHRSLALYKMCASNKKISKM